MKRPLVDIFSDIAKYATDRNQEFLAYIVRMAAIEAAANAPDETFIFPGLNPKNLAVGLWDWDVPNNIRYLDETGAGFFGYSKKKRFSEQNLTDRIHPDDVAKWRRNVSSIASTGGMYRYDYRIVRNGRVIWLRAKGQCLLGRSGRPERFSGALIDITQMKRTTMRDEERPPVRHRTGVTSISNLDQ